MNIPKPAHEHEFEAAHGLPELLPPGEKILWQGAPDWWTVAVRVMHIKTLAIYFALMLLWRSGTVISETGSMVATLKSIALPVPLALTALGLLALFAWLTSRTTVYTFTNRRVVMRIGIVLSVTFNLPYRKIESANLRAYTNGTGDIALLLTASDKIAFANLWPHARPWRVKRPEPMLRAIPDVATVGKILAAAIDNTAAAGQAAIQPLPLRHIAPAPIVNDTSDGRSSPLTA